MGSHPSSPPPEAEFLLYQTEDGHTRVEVRFEGDTLWLTQAALAASFQTTPQNITQHIAAIYSERELDEGATCKPFLQVREEGPRRVQRNLKHYSLPVILAVGYRVRSHRGTQFRQWATARLDEYLRKGFTLDDSRLKNPPGPGVPGYFDELLARIRDLRTSDSPHNGPHCPPPSRSTSMRPSNRSSSSRRSILRAARGSRSDERRPGAGLLAQGFCGVPVWGISSSRTTAPEAPSNSKLSTLPECRSASPNLSRQ